MHALCERLHLVEQAAHLVSFTCNTVNTASVDNEKARSYQTNGIETAERITRMAKRATVVHCFRWAKKPALLMAV